MTSDSSIFTSITRPVIAPIIYTIVNSIMHVQNIGTINTLKLSISDVFHVSKVLLNLLSVGQLCELGIDIHFFESLLFCVGSTNGRDSWDKV